MLCAVAPFVSWSVKNQCLKLTRWVLFHWGEMRTKTGSWVENLLKANYGIGGVVVDRFEGGDGPYCFEKAVVMRHDLGRMWEERKMEVFELLRCKAREVCGLKMMGRGNEQNGIPLTRLTLLMRRGSRAFKNGTAVADVFAKECARIKGCILSVVQSEDLSFCDQVRVMTNTDIMASPHGAQLTNMLFMDRGSSIMELFPKGWLVWVRGVVRGSPGRWRALQWESRKASFCDMAKVKRGSVVSRRSAQQSLAGSSGISKLKVDKSKKNLFKAKEDTNPPIVPPAEYWCRAPFFGAMDLFWARVDLFDDNGRVPTDFLLGGVEPEKGVEAFVPLEFIVRFHMERGTYPYSFPAIEDYTGPKDDFDVWSAAIFRHPLYCEVLAGAKIATAISQCMRIRREPSWLEFTLSRWSSSSHTFITQWGETTPTLEDVVVLTGLGHLGSANPSVGSLSLNQMAIVGRLEEAVAPAGKLLSHYQNKVLVTSRSRKRPKNTFGGWFRYWFRDLSHQVQGNAEDGFIGPRMEGDKWGSVEHLAAFITYWLSRYVLMGRPQDGICHELFPLAAILASGRPILLAHLFLGRLYKRLDMYQEGVDRSKGRYDVTSFLPATFLQLFLYERLPSWPLCQRCFLLKKVSRVLLVGLRDV
ncbi:unnamed protein product [Camellia sinensis]